VATDRLAVWSDRLKAPGPRSLTVVAENAGGIVGFAHTILDADPTWGALLENLHVAHAVRRRGIGAALMMTTARLVIEREPSQGLHLWVLEQNTAAQAFYDAMGGNRLAVVSCSRRAMTPSRLNGTPTKLRYAWRDPSVLLGRPSQQDHPIG
jgi:GNAT superfamily N-acetyltransferase